MSSALEATGESESDPTACPECGGRLRQQDHETACTDCGLVTAEDYLDRGPEWRGFEAAGRRRVGPAHNSGLHDGGRGSVIGRGRGLSPMQRRLHARARMASKADRGRAYAFGEVHRMAGSLGLPGVVRKTACRTYAEAQDAGLLPGRSHEAMATAALVAAARIHGEAVTFAEAEAASRVDRRPRGPASVDRRTRPPGVRSTYRALVRELGLPVPPPEPAGLVAGLCEALELGEAVRTRAEALAREHADALVGRKPQGVAAAAVYLATGRTVTQDALAGAADVTPPTIRKAVAVMEGGDGE